MRPRNIFTYGSLMFAEVWQDIVRGQYENHIAWLDDFRRTYIHGDTYPVILPRTGEKDLEGVLYLSVNELDLHRLDCFEGDYYYRRRVFAKIKTANGYKSIEADVFVLKSKHAHLASLRKWDANEFEKLHLKNFRRIHSKGRSILKFRDISRPTV
jgi:gamma-glutamylcyclotransferase (GGCT)/AIG2-like uncharacterized protein YtfP